MTPDSRENQPSPPDKNSANLPYQPYNQSQEPAQYQYSQPPATYQPTSRGKPLKRSKNPLLLWGGLLGGLVMLAAIAILVIIPLFNRSTRTEADPFAAAGGGAALAATAPNPTSASAVTTTIAAVSNTTGLKNMVGTAVATSTVAAERANSTTGSSSTIAANTATQPTTAAPAAPPGATAKITTAAQVFGKGEFTKIDAIHYARGTATVGVSADGKKVLRFDNFTSNQGPDLRVYLGTRPDGSKVKEGGFNLGALPATDGSYNINLPDSADLSKYKSVVIWCEAFNVTFSVASLS